MLAAVRAVLGSPVCAPFFGGPHLRWAGAEVPVSAAGQTVRVDRLVALQQGDGPVHWWVLDYKLQHRPAEVEAYREQLQNYVAAVQALQPEDRVTGAFITGRGELVPLD